MSWIPVRERLPKEGERVLILVDLRVSIGYWIEIWNEDRNMFENMWYSEQRSYLEPKCWMPLPTPPGGEG